MRVSFVGLCRSADVSDDLLNVSELTDGFTVRDLPADLGSEKFIVLLAMLFRGITHEFYVSVRIGDPKGNVGLVGTYPVSATYGSFLLKVYLRDIPISNAGEHFVELCVAGEEVARIPFFIEKLNGAGEYFA